MGLLTLPYMFVFEFLAPIIELVGLIVFIYLAFTGAVNWNTAWMIYLTIYTICQFLSICLYVFLKIILRWILSVWNNPRAQRVRCR